MASVITQLSTLYTFTKKKIQPPTSPKYNPTPPLKKTIKTSSFLRIFLIKFFFFRFAACPPLIEIIMGWKYIYIFYIHIIYIMLCKAGKWKKIEKIEKKYIYLCPVYKGRATSTPFFYFNSTTINQPSLYTTTIHPPAIRSPFSFFL